MALDTVAAGGPAPAGMNDALQRLRRMRLRLAPHIQLGSVRQNNRLVYRAHDPVGGRTTELSPVAAELLLACDGRHALGDLIRLMQLRLPGLDDRAMAEEVLAIVGAAEAGGLLLPLERRGGGFPAPVVPSLFWRMLRNPLFARFSLFNPAALFERLTPLANVLFSPLGLVLWLAIVGTGASLAFANWDVLYARAQQEALAGHNLIWLAVLFPVVKVLHETGHGLATTRWGGQVRDLGLSLMVFVPIPFVDCSDSAFFVRRRQRVLVAAAGMMVEFVIASFALATWLVSTNDIVRIVAFNIMVLTSITTVLFNANPLLRYDAYYILSELLGIDNLGSKAQAMIAGWARRLFLGDLAVSMPARPPFETLVLLAYGIGSLCYRFVLVFAIVAGIFPRFFALGFVLAGWAALSMIVMPVGKRAMAIYHYVEKAEPPARRRVLRRGVVLLAGLLVVLLVPVPYAVVADGSIRLPPESAVRAAGSGVVDSLPRGLSGSVAAGETLVVLSNPVVVAQLKTDQATLVSDTRKYQALLASDLAQANLAKSDMDVAAGEVADDQRDVAALLVKSPGAGRLEIAEGITPGVYVDEGGEIGAVLDDNGPRTATVLVAQEDADLINSRLASIAVRPVSPQSPVHTATMAREYVVAVQQPQAQKNIAPPPPESRFAFELNVAGGQDLAYGTAVKVRFDLGFAPLSVQGWRGLRIWYEKLMLSRYINETS